MRFFGLLGTDDDAYLEGTLEGSDDEGRKIDRKDDEEKILNRLLLTLELRRSLFYKGGHALNPVFGYK